MSAVARSLVVFGCYSWVLAGLGKPILILVGGIDFAGALWTAAALRNAPRAAGSREP